MPRPPSKHGLEKKFKPWRRGKSSTVPNKPKGSLRQVLRGKERLLMKVPKDQDERRAELEKTIKELKEQISGKEGKEKERNNAVKSHGARFLERQKLTRMEQATRKLWEQANKEEKTRYEAELQRIALDQVYVAHFPHDQKYLPLFRSGNRVTDTERFGRKRSDIRQRILKRLGSKELEYVKWIANDQYNRVPNEWNFDREKKVFEAGSVKNDNRRVATNDDRFALNQDHSVLLEAAENVDTRVEKEMQQVDHISLGHSSESEDESSSSSDDDDDEADPLEEGKKNDQAEHDDSSSDDSSIVSSSSSDDSSDESDEEQEIPSVKASVEHPKYPDKTAVNADEDDFLLPETEENPPTVVFDNAKQHAAEYTSTGDKSKGWSTQRQRPDQRKRRRMQR